MKRNTRFWFSALLSGLLLAVLALGGCGSDGSDGAPGAQGPAGADGVDAFNAENLVALGLQDSVVALNPVLDLSNTVDYDATTGVLSAHFFLTDGTDANNGVDVFSDAYELRFYVAELIDNGNNTGQSWNRLIYERGTPVAEDPDDRLPGTLTLLDAETGEYNYVFSDTLPASGNVFRVTARARWRENVFDRDGNRIRINFANSVNASYDFFQADPATELTSSGADIVTTEACESCHGDRIGNVGHGGGYTKVETCNNCHNVNYMASINGGEGDLAFMVHRIHNAGSFDQLEDGIDFSEVTYPQHIYTCSKCHTADAANSNLSELVPTSMNCGSCHSDVNFVTGDNHPAGPQTDANCALCHKAGFAIGGVSLDPADVHNPDPEPANVPEYAVTIDMTPPTNGTYYVAGEAPLVTVTLSGDNPVNYTANQDTQGDTDGVLSDAELMIYGPRSNAVPVLATDTVQDTVGYVAPPTQRHSLFLADSAAVANPDGLVATDAGGFKYQLLPIPADMPPGTYMVRFEGFDYGDISDTDYITASNAMITFKIRTDVEEPKVSGDACINCHGDTRMHQEGQYSHNQAFDTDGCLACHDVSGNYGDYIGNRVHAVHSASATGDLKNNDWSDVTFPRPANNCRTCHTNSAAAVPVWRDPNEVACGGCHGTQRDAVPADYPDVEPDKILAEAAAAAHMEEMGGTFDATTTNPNDPDYVARQCIVCHGEGRIADLFVTHGLVNFPVTDTSTPED